MSDPRPPRPQYGEYATPEEQRARIQVPLDQNEGVPAGAAEPQRPAWAPQAQRAQQPHAQPVSSRPVPGDRLATYILLGVGLASILFSITSMIRMPLALDLTFEQFGIGAYTSDSLATAMGWTSLVVHVVLWVGAFLLARRFIAAGRTSWWIPLVAGVIANLVFLVCIGIAMASDPAFIEYMHTMTR